MPELINYLRNLNDSLFVFFAILSVSILLIVGIFYLLKKNEK